MIVENFIKELEKYPKDSEIVVHVYDMGNVELYSPELSYQTYYNKLVITPNFEEDN